MLFDEFSHRSRLKKNVSHFLKVSLIIPSEDGRTFSFHEFVSVLKSNGFSNDVAGSNCVFIIKGRQFSSLLFSRVDINDRVYSCGKAELLMS